MTSPTLARYRAFWLEAPERDSRYIAQSISTRSVSDETQTAARPFAVVVGGLALGPQSVPQLTSGGPGIQAGDPLLSFG